MYFINVYTSELLTISDEKKTKLSEHNSWLAIHLIKTTYNTANKKNKSEPYIQELSTYTALY